MGLEDILEGIFGQIEQQTRQKPDRRVRGPQPRPAENDETGIGRVSKSVVQVVALKSGFLGGMSSAWTGSGSIVDPSGIILTNCHVANPRAMGMSSPPADRLGIAVTDRSDEPPAITYFAEVVAQNPRLDLAVLRIVSDSRGQRTSNLDLPSIPLGDSDKLSLGEHLAIIGYPGIGGETITFTSGNVSGFSKEGNIARGWIKTDATIAGGNSGGTAVDQTGHLVGVPTQAAAGSGITPVDARPVLDTNRDGRVDRRDTPMAIGGFINGLRPINLAVPLLEEAGMDVQAARGAARRGNSILPGRGISSGPAMPKAQPKFSDLLFSSRITPDGRSINPTTRLPSGMDTVYATFEHAGIDRGTPWSVVWMSDGEVIIDQKDTWDEEAYGRKVVKVSNRKGLPNGEYHLVLGIGGSVALEGKMVVGTPVDETDSEVAGRVVDEQTGRGVGDALVIVLNPNASLQKFMRNRNNADVFTSTQTDSDGHFKFPKQLPKGYAYSLIAAAQGYEPIAVDGALRVSEGAPEHADIGELPMERL